MLLLASVFRSFLIVQNLGMLDRDGPSLYHYSKNNDFSGRGVLNLALGRLRQENQKFKDCLISCK